MSDASLRPLCLAAGSVGVLSHISYWAHGHHDPYVARILGLHLAAYLAIVLGQVSLHDVTTGFVYATAASSSYLGCLFACMTVYRLFFHRLRHFPGPLAAKITKLYGPWMAGSGKMHEKHLQLVKQYGDIVRSGPNELILFNIDAIEKVHGAHSRCTKHRTMYDYFQYNGAENLDSIRDREPHRWRRQVWDRALNNKALETYETYTRSTIEDWLAKIDSYGGKPINTSLFAVLIPFDNIGKVAYSNNFGSVKAGKDLPMLSLIETLFRTIGTLGHLDWPLPLTADLKLGKEQIQFEEIAVRMIDEREERSDEDPEDMVKYFLEDLKSAKPKAFFDRNVLHSDSQAILIGGAPTLGSALGYVFYHIAKYPAVRKQIYESLAPVFGRSIPGQFKDSDLATVEYLDAVINESMRMVSPGGSNAPRNTPPEGIEVGGVFIPGNVKIFTPIYAFSLSEKYFVEPEKFIPERWTTRPELVLDKRAFFPFLIGPFNCAGKRLALMLIRLVVANTLWYYDFEFAPGEDGLDIFKKARNQLVVKPGKLEVVFTKRT